MFSDLVTDLFSGFSTVITNLSSGIKTGFSHLIYVDPDVANPVIAPLPKFIFVMAGVGLATGVLFKVFGMIRARKG